MFFDKIYCLSIEQNAQRREHITKEFHRVGLTTYHLWDAYTPDSQEVIDFINNGKVQSFPPCFRCGKIYCDCANNVLTPPQVSNFLGFIAIFKDISRTCQDDELVAICEDDIVIYENRLNKANDLLGKEYLESQLGYRPEEPFLLRLTSPFQSEDDDKRELTITRDKVVMSNPFFVINKAAAKYFVDQFDSIGATSDLFIHRDVGQKMNNFSVDPPLCHDLSWNTGQFASAIRPKENHVQYLKTTGAETEVIEAAEQRLQKSLARVNPSKILILGHPRGATGYIAEVFKSFDLEVGHEDIGPAGTASWMFAVEDDNPYFLPAYSMYANNRKDNYFEHIIHLVRDPFKSMASIVVENRKAPLSYQYRRKHILRLYDIDLDQYKNKLEQAIVSYLYWHKIIHSQQPSLTIRVERDLSRLLEFLSENQLLDQDLQTSSLTERVESINNDLNSNKPYKGTVQKKPVFSRQEWEAIDGSLKQQLNEFCTQYHYPALFSNNGQLVDPNRKFVVCHPGQTGASSVCASLANFYGEQVININLCEQLNQRQESKDSGSDSGKNTPSRILEEGRSDKVYSIIILREPVAWALATIWQNLKYFNGNNEICKDHQVFLPGLRSCFDQKSLNFHSIFSWAEHDFRPFIDCSINDLVFDREKGYGLTESPQGPILLIAYERLQEVFTQSIAELTGSNGVELISRSSDRKLSDDPSFRVASKNLSLAKGTLKQLYSQSYSQLLYSQEQLNVFTKLWLPSSRPTVYLHIGHHKTGTTSLQNFFVKNRLKLEEAGFLYPETGRFLETLHHRLAWSLWEKPWPHHDIVDSALANTSSEDLFKELHAEITQRGLPNILISSEEFSSQSNIEYCTKLKQFLDTYLSGHTVKIIVSLRRQDEALEARYKQFVTHRYGRLSFDSAEYTPELDSMYHAPLDYRLALAPWKEVFGKENLIVTSYKKYADKNSLFYSFCSLLGVDIDQSWEFDLDYSNDSSSAMATQIMRRVNAFSGGKGENYLFFSELRKLYKDRASLISPERRQELKDKYADANRQVAQEYLGQDDLFEDLPPPTYYEEDKDLLLYGMYTHLFQKADTLESLLTGSLQPKDQTLSDLVGMLKQAEETISSKAHEIMQQTQQAQQQNRAIQQKDLELNNAHNHIRLMRGSLSWRLTTPLRAVKYLFIRPSIFLEYAKKASDKLLFRGRK